MEKKTFIAAIIVSLLLASLVGILAANVAEANPIPPWWLDLHFEITIESPKNGTSCNLPIEVNFTAEGNWCFPVANSPSFFHVLDGQNMSLEAVRFTNIQYPTPVPELNKIYHYSGQASLANLSTGYHNLTVFFGFYNNESWSATSNFYVNTDVTSSQTPSTSAYNSSLTPTESPTVMPSPSPSPTPTESPLESTTQTPTLEPTLSPTQNVTISPIGEPKLVWTAYQLEVSAVGISLAFASLATFVLVYRKIKKQK